MERGHLGLRKAGGKRGMRAVVESFGCRGTIWLEVRSRSATTPV
jgi:hypothetical protein